MNANVQQTSLQAFARRASLAYLLGMAWPAYVTSQQDTSPTRTPDVHFVPTDPKAVGIMLSAAKVGSKDVVYDLGCGDGRFVITAVKRHGARGVCVDIDPVRIAESRQNADTAGVARRITFHEGDLFEMDLSDATVVTLYLLPALNERLRPKLFRELRPGARVVSNAFDMGDWEADSMLRMNPTSSFPAFGYLWVMPADVAGVWNVTVTGAGGTGARGERQYEVRMDQRYQQVKAAGTAGGRRVAVTDAMLKGDRLGFAIQDSGRDQTLRFAGRVTGDRAAGTVTGAGEKNARWTAVRAERGPRPELEPEGADEKD
ncbi:MAG: class I SAM-dependent methyltransferase [Gemmatimonadales bacterium]